jgi:hypothetical protein
MARVSTRVGWGRGSAGSLAWAAFNMLLAVGLWLGDYQGPSLVVLGFVAVLIFFAFVHPGRVLELDEDDDPRRKVGDLADD